MTNKTTLCAMMAIALLYGCKTSEHAVKVEAEGLTAAECGSEHVQRLITFCASPQAADLAKRNADLRGHTAGGGDVPYSPLPIGDSPARGPDDAPVTVVMFTDLECPYCQQMHETLNALQEQSPSDVRLVFKHTPLAFHPNAVPAALGALAAREQGKFWEYVDRVYEAQADLTENALLSHASELGLDMEQFQNDFGSAGHIAAIESDLGLAAQVGVRGTPTMFVNGVRVVGVYPQAEVGALITKQKKLVERLREAGVQGDDLYWRMVAVQYDPSEVAQMQTNPQVPEQPEVVVAHVPVDGAPTRGATTEQALVTIVEFSDFQCPFCADANETLDAIIEQNAADTRLAFRHFPLGNHADALPAARAALVAQEAGKFWEFHDRLFAGQDQLSTEALKGYAAELGIEPAKIEAALVDGERKARVAQDQKLGTSLGVGGTPTLFVNGIMVLGITSPDEFTGLVRQQRALARSVAEETGLKGEELYQELVKRNQQALGVE